ncbi:MAG: hypothetical protein H0W81_06400 [Chloroflexi bacterium]|nr:hypothetical protein [Chloroflexota bacterium]
MTDPATVLARLDEIEHDLAHRQNALESAARKWIVAKRDKEKAKALVFLQADGSVAARQAQADRATALDGKDEEAEYVALKAVVDVLGTRASIGQSILRAMGNA